jgi:hypothetical protein
VAHLKRDLEEKTDETQELSERLTAMEDLRKDELREYKKKEKTMEFEYRTMESNLSHELKLAGMVHRDTQTRYVESMYESNLYLCTLR